MKLRRYRASPGFFSQKWSVASVCQSADRRPAETREFPLLGNSIYDKTPERGCCVPKRRAIAFHDLVALPHEYWPASKPRQRHCQDSLAKRTNASTRLVSRRSLPAAHLRIGSWHNPRRRYLSDRWSRWFCAQSRLLGTSREGQPTPPPVGLD